MENDLSPSKKFSPATLFSPQTYVAIFARAWRQFPFTVCYIIVLGIAQGCWLYHNDTSLPQSIVAGLTLGALLSVIAKQWSDYRELRYGLVLQLCAALFTAAAVACIYNIGRYWSEEFSAAYWSMLIFLAIAALTAPVSKRLHDNKVRYLYTRQLVIRLTITGLTFLFMLVISMLFSFTLTSLFNVTEKLIFAVLIPLLAVVPPTLYFISGYLTKEGSAETGPAPGNLFDRFCKNILLPLAAVYAVILYAYGIKMLHEMSLPRTSVTLMVSGLMAAVFVLLFGIQVYRFAPEANPKAAKIASSAFRWWPVAMVPLLIMMSIAIGYRVHQYGWTAPRLYVTLFNILGYAACIYGSLSKSPRMDLIASGVIIPMLLASVIPEFNFTSFGVRNTPERISAQLKGIGVTELPVPYEKLCARLNSIHPNKADSLIDDITYLQRELGARRIRGIVTGDVPRYSYEFHEDIRESNADGKEFWTKMEGKDALSPIPQGYSSIEYVSCSADNLNTKYLGKDSIEINVANGITIPFNLNRLVQTKGNKSALPIHCRVISAPDDLFLLTDFSLYSVKEIKKEDDFGTFRFSGFYLKK